MNWKEELEVSEVEIDKKGCPLLNSLTFLNSIAALFNEQFLRAYFAFGLYFYNITSGQ
ncbi:hypothetical protein M2347_003822 [Chryseobacterium sp. H1D6B]|nr:hypothetical protein [Chryseobacterium sp. H1D6B]